MNALLVPVWFGVPVVIRGQRNRTGGFGECNFAGKTPFWNGPTVTGVSVPAPVDALNSTVPLNPNTAWLSGTGRYHRTGFRQ
ncbi:MAG: hypothetical protein R3C26_21225 [Calditrichia bacterium]